MSILPTAAQYHTSSPEKGRLLIQSYNSRSYGASPQNWAVLQNRSGILYVGNNEVLLEFDGRVWKKVQGTQSGAFSLGLDSNDRLFVGGSGDFGYLEKNVRGDQFFVSLLDRVPSEARDFGVVRSVLTVGEAVFFQAQNWLFIWENRQLKAIPTPDSYLRAFHVEDRYLLRLYGQGLCAWSGNRFLPLPGTEVFSSEVVAAILPFSKNTWLIGSQNQGLWLYDQRQAKLTRPEGFEAIQEGLREAGLYHGIRLPDGNFAFATVSRGILLVSPKGRLIRRIGPVEGLNDPTVHFLALDQQQGLWAATNKGINRISLSAPFEYWDAAMGLDAPVLSLLRYRGALYAGTSLGLYVMRPSASHPEPSVFRTVGNLRDQIFQLCVFPLSGSSDTLLLLATSSGLYQYEDKEGLKAVPGVARGAWYSLLPDRKKPGRLFLGGNAGLYSLEFSGGRPGKAIALASPLPQVRSLEQDSQGNLWIGTRNRGFFRLSPTADGSWAGKPYENLQGKPAMGSHRIFTYGDQLLFRSSNSGTYRYDAGGDSLAPFSFPGINAPAWIGANGSGRQAWVWAPGPAGLHLELLLPLAGGSVQRLVEPFGALPAISDFFQGAIYPEQEDRCWLGGSEGLFRFDYSRLAAFSVYKQPFPVLLREVQIAGDSSVSTGNFNGLVLPYRHNSLSLRFAAAAFERPEATLFQSFLKGYESSWSPWTERTEREYTNLPPGNYTFQVRARNAFGQISESQTYFFEIQAPWYQSWWAYLIYLGLMGILLGIGVRLLTLRQARRLAREQLINERLRTADKLKDQFLANTSHELRTPLNGIIGLSEALLEGLGKWPEDKQREELSLIAASGRRLAGLVNDLLDFSRLREGEIQLRQHPLYLRALAEVVLLISRPLAIGKELRLENEVPEDFPAVFADEDRLQQILINLVGNAIKFTDSGFVRIEAEEKTEERNGKNWVEVRVVDSGIGIDPEKQELIFQAFEQADGSIERQYGGTGLGLSISRRLVDLHGGRIWVHSTPGQGAAFSFTLPLASGEEKALEPSALQPPKPMLSPAHVIPVESNSPVLQPAGGLGRGILIIDDEPVNHHVLRNHLQSAGYRTFSAMNGEEGLRLLQEREPEIQLVLLDLMMPRMNGLEVCRRIRSFRLASELPVLMVTAKNQVPDLVEGLAVGANDYLAKPFSRDELLARVRTQLDLSQVFETAARFVPNEFIRSLGRERFTEVALGDHIEQEVTVLFTDIRNYTTFSESMSPNENFRFVNAHHGRMGPIIQKKQGFVNQYLGDAIMALFPTSPADALGAAVEMQFMLQDYNQQRRLKGRLPVRVGMGMHTGQLIMGIIGDQRRLEAATVADTVNMASRIESLTKFYGANILLSEDSLKIILQEREKSFNVRYLGKVLVKGKREPVGIYECFDGDPPELAAAKLAGAAQFDMALQHYLAREFSRASALFYQVFEANPNDYAARLFQKKADNFLMHGTPDGWSGVEIMEGK